MVCGWRRAAGGSIAARRFQPSARSRTAATWTICDRHRAGPIGLVIADMPRKPSVERPRRGAGYQRLLRRCWNGCRPRRGSRPMARTRMSLCPRKLATLAPGGARRSTGDSRSACPGSSAVKRAAAEPAARDGSSTRVKRSAQSTGEEATNETEHEPTTTVKRRRAAPTRRALARASPRRSACTEKARHDPGVRRVDALTPSSRRACPAAPHARRALPR